MTDGFFLTRWFFEAMRWIYEQTASFMSDGYGSVFLTILLATTLLRLITVFSDIKTRKSSAAMAVVQPEIAKIQKRYENDPRKAQQEQAKLMKERGVSMWSSCLPLLITMPLFFCFFAAFRHWGSEMTVRLLVEDNAMELFKSFKFLWINNIWQPDNGTSPVIASGATFLATADLSNLIYLKGNTAAWDKLIELGIAIKGFVDGVPTYSFLNTESAIAAYDAAVQPFIDIYAGYNNGWFLMSVFAGGSNFLSAWLLQRSQPQQSGQAGQSSKWMTYLFPVMSFVFCLQYNAAFAVYWTLSSVYMIIINLILNKVYPRTPAVEVEKK